MNSLFPVLTIKKLIRNFCSKKCPKKNERILFGSGDVEKVRANTYFCQGEAGRFSVVHLTTVCEQA